MIGKMVGWGNAGNVTNHVSLAEYPEFFDDIAAADKVLEKIPDSRTEFRYLHLGRLELLGGCLYLFGKSMNHPFDSQVGLSRLFQTTFVSDRLRCGQVFFSFGFDESRAFILPNMRRASQEQLEFFPRCPMSFFGAGCGD